MLKHYVEYIYPGIIVSETSTKEVLSRNPKSVLIPDSAYGFRFIDREEVELNGEKLKGDNKNISRWYYRGRQMTLEDVKREKPEEEILISNMERNDWKSIVWTKFNQAIPLDKGDTVLTD